MWKYECFDILHNVPPPHLPLPSPYTGTETENNPIISCWNKSNLTSWYNPSSHSISVNPCDDLPCNNNGRCLATSASLFQCICTDGCYFGTFCEICKFLLFFKLYCIGSDGLWAYVDLVDERTSDHLKYKNLFPGKQQIQTLDKHWTCLVQNTGFGR